MAGRMRAKLTEALQPIELEIQDDSEKHRGHGGYMEGGETHFNVRIRSAAFNGLNRVARQRLVYRIVAAELEERVHALSLSLIGSEE